jgi:SAM-dependent methyltransferase
MARVDIPDWRLPAGVPRSVWEYAQSPGIAADYDEALAQTPLAAFDARLLAGRIVRPGLIVDLGAGTGRSIVPFARRGFSCLAVDLSLPMLRVLGGRIAAERLPVDRIVANIVELDCLRDQIADYCLLLFSTLGMVRGRAARLRVLRHVRRLLKPGGVAVVHVHNRRHDLLLPRGLGRLARDTWRVAVGGELEPGDRLADSYGIPNFFLHLYSRRELQSDLRAAGLALEELIALDVRGEDALRPSRVARLWRAGGWIALCRPAA